MIRKKLLRIPALAIAASIAFSITACGISNNNSVIVAQDTTSETIVLTGSGEDITNSNDGEHAIEVSGETAGYSNIKVTKTGDSDSGDEADFYGDNSAIFATDGATLTLTDITVDTNGTHANAVFSYGSGTTVNISNSKITTSGNCRMRRLHWHVCRSYLP